MRRLRRCGGIGRSMGRGTETLRAAGKAELLGEKSVINDTRIDQACKRCGTDREVNQYTYPYIRSLTPACYSISLSRNPSLISLVWYSLIPSPPT